MAVQGKDYGEKPPTSFPQTLEIDRTDSHIPSTPTTAANLTQTQSREEPSPVRLTFAPSGSSFNWKRLNGGLPQ